MTSMAETTPVTGAWRPYPPIQEPTPVLAILARPGSIWAGGPGGLARYRDGEGWAPPLAGLPLRAVTALAAGEGSLLAAGDVGIAWSRDDGRTWRLSLAPDATGTVTALALSPAFVQDDTALAGTLDNGVLRSTDGGRTWQTSRFGLPDSEVLAFVWGTGESVIAATSSGLFQSPNAGRAWRAISATSGRAFTALAARPRGEVLAAPEIGPPLRSAGNLADWTPVAGLPDDVRISALLPLEAGILLGAAEHGLLRADEDCANWKTVSGACVLCFAADATTIFAGTTAGMIVSHDGGETWSNLPSPPLNDLRQIMIAGGHPLLVGTNSAPVREVAGEWIALADTPIPLTGFFVAPEAGLFASAPDGLFRSSDRGASWQLVAAGNGGAVTQMTFAPGGRGWAGITADGALLRTADGGRTWERLASPFGVLPLIALQAMPGLAENQQTALIAATYDPRQHAVAIWRSDDGGEHWTRGGDSFTSWPVVATWATPPLIAIGNVLTSRQKGGEWRQTTVGETGIRRVVSDGTAVIAQAADGLWRSDDQCTTWRHDDVELPIDELLDIALDDHYLFALLSGGRVWRRLL
jgi:photosystem II stability/assembly factor-like uncharacterized protein